MMRIFVDADACPVVDIVELIAEKYNIPVTLLCDTNHVLYSDYSDVIVVGAGADAVDYKLISIVIRMMLWYLTIMELQLWRLAKGHTPSINPVSGTRMKILIRC